MAQYYTDFKGETTGELPSNWTLRWDSKSSYSYVIDASTYRNDRALAHRKSGDANRSLVTWDDVDGTLDAESVVRIVPGASDAARVMLRAKYDSTNGYEVAYFARLTTDAFEVMEYDPSGNYYRLADTTYSWSTGNKYWIRFRVNGSTLSAKVWADGETEPSSWTLQTTDSSNDTSGWIGVGSYSGDHDLDVQGAADNGDTAPKVPPNGIQFIGSGSSTGTGTATIYAYRGLLGSASSTGSSTGTAYIWRDLTASEPSSASGSAVMNAYRGVSGTAQASAAGSGVVTRFRQVAGTGGSTAGATGTASVWRDVTGSGTSTATGSATAMKTRSLQGSGVGDTTGSSVLLVERVVSGSSGSTSGTTGLVLRERSLGATETVESTGTGQLAPLADLLDNTHPDTLKWVETTSGTLLWDQSTSAVLLWLEEHPDTLEID